jgi:hypothetical protein
MRRGEYRCTTGCLQLVTSDSVLWGGATKNDYEPSHNKLIRLDVFAWCKLYLSLFAFYGTHAAEHRGNGDDLLRLDAGIRPIAPEEFVIKAVGKNRSFRALSDEWHLELRWIRRMPH